MEPTPNKSQHTRLTLEKKILRPHLQGIWTSNLLIKSLALYQQAIPAPSARLHQLQRAITAVAVHGPPLSTHTFPDEFYFLTYGEPFTVTCGFQRNMMANTITCRWCQRVMLFDNSDICHNHHCHQSESGNSCLTSESGCQSTHPFWPVNLDVRALTHFDQWIWMSERSPILTSESGCQSAHPFWPVNLDVRALTHFDQWIWMSEHSSILTSESGCQSTHPFSLDDRRSARSRLDPALDTAGV